MRTCCDDGVHFIRCRGRHRGCAYLKKCTTPSPAGKIGNLRIFGTSALCRDEAQTRVPTSWSSWPIACPFWSVTTFPVPPVTSPSWAHASNRRTVKLAGGGLAQLAASKPGSSNGMMLGACVFLNEERPGDREEKTAAPSIPVGPKGWWWLKDPTYPVEQQARTELSIGRKFGDDGIDPASHQRSGPLNVRARFLTTMCAYSNPDWSVEVSAPVGLAQR